MKHFLILVIIFTIATTSSAQKFGIKAGLNLSNMVITDDNETYSDDFEMNLGYHAGVTVEFSLADKIGLETGLLLSTRGFKSSLEEEIFGELFKVESQFNLLYLEIPITAKASFDVGSAKVYGALGPYIGIALNGNVKSEVTISGETETDEADISFGSDENEDDFKNLDFGLTIGAGVEIKSIEIGLFYGLGLANISPYTGAGSTIQNRVVGLSVGYKFGGE